MSDKYDFYFNFCPEPYFCVWTVFPHWVIFHICRIYPWLLPYLGTCVYSSFINFDKKIGDFLPIR